MTPQNALLNGPPGHQTYLRRARGATVRSSTLAIAFGLGLFALPIPGTFVTGGLVTLAGGAARWLGS